MVVVIFLNITYRSIYWMKNHFLLFLTDWNIMLTCNWTINNFSNFCLFYFDLKHYFETLCFRRISWRPSKWQREGSWIWWLWRYVCLICSVFPCVIKMVSFDLCKLCFNIKFSFCVLKKSEWKQFFLPNLLDRINYLIVW